MTRRTVPIRGDRSASADGNAQRQRKAIKKMDQAEALCGIPAAELRAQQQAMKAAALRRFTK